MAHLQVLDFVDLALQLAAAHFPPTPRVVGFYRKLGVDSQGKDSLLIWVVLADGTPDADLRYERVRPIEEAILAALADRDLDLRPYVYFRLKAEHESLLSGAA